MKLLLASLLFATSAQAQMVLDNVSQRAFVGAGDNVMILGFVVNDCDDLQSFVIRARGPSLIEHGIVNAILDPMLTLHDATGRTIDSNDNWQDPLFRMESAGANRFRPSDPRESMILISLRPGAYTAVMRGVGGTTGVGILEIFPY